MSAPLAGGRGLLLRGGGLLLRGGGLLVRGGGLLVRGRDAGIALGACSLHAGGRNLDSGLLGGGGGDRGVALGLDVAARLIGVDPGLRHRGSAPSAACRPTGSVPLHVPHQ